MVHPFPLNEPVRIIQQSDRRHDMIMQPIGIKVYNIPVFFNPVHCLLTKLLILIHRFPSLRHFFSSSLMPKIKAVINATVTEIAIPIK